MQGREGEGVGVGGMEDTHSDFLFISLIPSLNSSLSVAQTHPDSVCAPSPAVGPQA